MTKFKNKYRIESNRWAYWDYSAPAKYFITICTQNRKCIFGKIIDNKMILSPTGKIVADEIKNIPTYHPRIVLDEWVVMPNHIHLIIELKNYEYDNHMTVKSIKNNNGDGRDERNVEKIHEFSLPSTTTPSSTPPPSSPQHHQWWRNPDYKPNKNDIKQYRKFRRKMVIPKIIGKMKMVSSKKINILHQTSGHKNWQSKILFQHKKIHHQQSQKLE